jgi:hypothetical protein
MLKDSNPMKKGGLFLLEKPNKKPPAKRGPLI